MGRWLRGDVQGADGHLHPDRSSEIDGRCTAGIDCADNEWDDFGSCTSAGQGLHMRHERRIQVAQTQTGDSVASQRDVPSANVIGTRRATWNGMGDERIEMG